MSEKRWVIAHVVKDVRGHPFLLFGPLPRFRLYGEHSASCLDMLMIRIQTARYCWRLPNPTISLASNQIMQVSLLTAAAINLNRVSDWLAGGDREKTRRSAFARMTQPLTA
jgi:hypothetical protein